MNNLQTGYIHFPLQSAQIPKNVFLVYSLIIFLHCNNIYCHHIPLLARQWSSKFPLLMILLTITLKYIEAILVQYSKNSKLVCKLFIRKEL